MSIGLVEDLHKRIKVELDRLGLKMSATASAIGEENSQGLRDVVSGRKRASAELLAKLVAVGVDAHYVLTGERLNTSAPTHLGAVLAAVPNAATSPHLIDVERFSRVLHLLEQTAKKAGRKWPAKQLAEMAAEVYNVLDEPAFDEEKAERVLKLVVNR